MIETEQTAMYWVWRDLLKRISDGKPITVLPRNADGTVAWPTAQMKRRRMLTIRKPVCFQTRNA